VGQRAGVFRRGVRLVCKPKISITGRQIEHGCRPESRIVAVVLVEQLPAGIQQLLSGCRLVADGRHHQRDKLSLHFRAFGLRSR